MFCPKCGNKIADGSVFCPYCGQRMSTAERKENTKEQVPEETEYRYYQEDQNRKGRDAEEDAAETYQEEAYRENSYQEDAAGESSGYEQGDFDWEYSEQEQSRRRSTDRDGFEQNSFGYNDHDQRDSFGQKKSYEEDAEDFLQHDQYKRAKAAGEKRMRRLAVGLILLASVVFATVGGLYLYRNSHPSGSGSSGSQTVGEGAAAGQNSGAETEEKEEDKDADSDPQESSETKKDDSTGTQEDTDTQTQPADTDNDTQISDADTNTTVKSPTLTVAENSPSLSGYTKVGVSSANASSTIRQSTTSNDAMLMFDGSDKTSWQEGVSGYGEGETVDIYFDGTYELHYIAFKLGNWRNDKYYYGNAKPKTITLDFGTATAQVTFPDTDRITQYVELSTPVSTDHMQLRIDAVYPGTKWADTCINEIIPYGIASSGGTETAGADTESVPGVTQGDEPATVFDKPFTVYANVHDYLSVWDTSTRHAELTRVKPNTEFTVYGQTNELYYVKIVPTGEYGWVNSAYTKKASGSSGNSASTAGSSHNGSQQNQGTGTAVTSDSSGQSSGSIGTASDRPAAAAQIGEIDGKTYIISDYVFSSGLTPLPFSPAEFDYVCSFVSYDGRVYYSCKSDGTDGYGMAIYSCKPDGSDQQLIKRFSEVPENGFDLNQFAIEDGVLYYQDRLTGADTVYAYDLSSGTETKVTDVPQAVREYLEENVLYTEDGTFYKDSDGIICQVDEKGNEQEIASTTSYCQVAGVSGGKLYYTDYGNNDGILYSYDISSGEVEKLAEHATAGGGDPYFNW